MANPLEFLQLIAAVPQLFLGGAQIISASKQAKKNVRPIYHIDPAYQGNVDMIAANMGLPSSATSNYYNQIGQATGAGINAVTQTGSDPNIIARLIQNKNDAFNKVLIQDALAKKQDMSSWMAAKLALAGEKDKEWQLNTFDPYKDKAQAIAAEKAAGWSNFTGALNSIAGAGANAATGALGNEKTASTSTTPNSGVDYNAILRSIQPQSGFNQYQQPAPQMNLGANNLQYGLPNYSLYAPLFGNQQITQSQYGNGFDPFAFNPYLVNFQ